MPSGKTHDAVTFLLAAPTFGVAYLVSGDLRLAGIVGLGFLFGGLMFGPTSTPFRSNIRDGGFYAFSGSRTELFLSIVRHGHTG